MTGEPLWGYSGEGRSERWACLWVIVQHELPITGVSKQRPIGEQPGPSGRLDHRSPECLPFSVRTRPRVSTGTFSNGGDGPWLRKGADQQKRLAHGEGPESAWAALQGSLDTHRGRQGHFLLVSHRPISERKGQAQGPGSGTSRNPNISHKALQSCRNTPQACTLIRTHTVLLTRVQKALIHLLTLPHS